MSGQYKYSTEEVIGIKLSFRLQMKVL